MNIMRINRALSYFGVCSRRKADNLILEKKVTVNDCLVTDLSTKVDIDNDIIKLNEIIINKNIKFKYFITNKPINYLSSNQDPHYNLFARDLIEYKDHLFCAGRLDKDSEGLLIYTNDGEFCKILTHPRYEIEKEYIINIDKNMTSNDLKTFSEGIIIDGIKTKECKIVKIKELSYRIIIKEGRNRQIRKMCECLGYKVLKLKRIRHGKINLGDLEVGEYREFNSEELLYVKQLKELYVK